MALGAALERNGFAPESFRPALTGLAGLKTAGPVPTVEAIGRLGASPLRGVVDRHLIRRDGGYHLLFYLYYTGSEFNQKAFLTELAAADPQARVTSADLVSAQLASFVKKSFVTGFALGGALVLFLLLAHFESLFGMVCSLFPVIAGGITMLGGMAVTGMGLNFMNSMVLVTILGMGSDYGLHIAHRVGMGDDEFKNTDSFVQSGRAVLLSALTTIAGFGSLAFTDYGALASIGWATNFGIGATAFFALVTIPAFMACQREKPPS
jgi:predicted RND superfamily exporter protein